MSSISQEQPRKENLHDRWEKEKLWGLFFMRKALRVEMSLVLDHVWLNGDP